MSLYSYEGAKMFPIIFGRPVKDKEKCLRLNACTKTCIAGGELGNSSQSIDQGDYRRGKRWEQAKTTMIVKGGPT
jgi:hypothetical protein